MATRVISLKSVDVGRSLRSQLVQIVTATTFAVEAEAKVRAPIDKGILRNSTQANVDHAESKLLGYVEVGAEYGRAVEEGTRPHKIRPKGKKALYWKGARSPVRSVNHPGTAPQPFMRPAAKVVRSRIGQIAKSITGGAH
jgi:HK97 gp10 family phage protein